MSTLTKPELRELDAWIAEHVFGWEWLARSNDEPNGTVVSCWGKADDSMPLFSDWDRACAERDDDNRLWNSRKFGLPHYTTDPAAAMEVLRVCTEKRNEGYDTYCPDVTLCICAPHKDWDEMWIVASDAQHSIRSQAPTLELSICLFAKKLFTK